MGRPPHFRLGCGLVALGTAIVLVSLLGPLALGVIHYRTSPTSLNQIVGSDAAGLLLVAPFSIVVGLLVMRGRAVTRLGLAPAVYAAYIYPQLALGNEFAVRPGNVERFFPLLVGVFVLAVVVAGAAWKAASEEPAATPSPRRDRFTGGLLLVAAAFITLGLHVPTYLDALSAHPVNVGYLTSPTAFWLVKFMDLGIVVPAAIAVGTGMLRGRPSARRPMEALLGAYAFLATSVSAMAIVMYAADDADASLGQVLVGSAVALGLLCLFVAVQRSTLGRDRGTRASSAPGVRREGVRAGLRSALEHNRSHGPQPADPRLPARRPRGRAARAARPARERR